MRNVHDLIAHVKEMLTHQWLGEEVSNVIGGWHEGNTDFTFFDALSARVHMMQARTLHHRRFSFLAVHLHLGARGVSCTELHLAPRRRRTSLHRHRRCESSAPSRRTGGAGVASRPSTPHCCCLGCKIRPWYSVLSAIIRLFTHNPLRATVFRASWYNPCS